MRCFAAVDVPDEIKRNITSLQDKLPKIGLRLVGKESMHFTLQFYGECSSEGIKFIETGLSKTISSFRSFGVQLKGVGAFPSQSCIKVIWVGCPALHDLMKSVQDALSDKFVPEKSIVPHLTIARVGYNADYEALRRFVKENEDYEAGFMNVHEIKLKQSVVTPQGPIYEDISTFKLLP